MFSLHNAPCKSERKMTRRFFECWILFFFKQVLVLTFSKEEAINCLVVHFNANFSHHKSLISRYNSLIWKAWHLNPTVLICLRYLHPENNTYKSMLNGEKNDQEMAYNWGKLALFNPCELKDKISCLILLIWLDFIGVCWGFVGNEAPKASMLEPYTLW